MSTPIVYGINYISTLLQSSGLQLSSSSSASSILHSSTDPTASAMSANPASLLINSSTGRLYRKLDSGSSTNWEQVSPGVYAIATSTAGNTLTNANTNYFLDFPTTDTDSNSGITGAGSGVNTTYTNTWRYVTPYAGYYCVSSTIECQSATAYNLFSSIYLNGTSTNSGNNTSFAGTFSRTTIASAIIKCAKSDAISIGATSSIATRIQSTTAASNKVVIWMMCRS